MSNYFCNKCKKLCAWDEVDLNEGSWEGDWEEVHLVCGEKVSWLLTGKPQ